MKINTFVELLEYSLIINTKSANAGNQEAMNKLGKWYGPKSVEGLAWYTKSAELGNKYAMLMLGQYYAQMRGPFLYKAIEYFVKCGSNFEINKILKEKFADLKFIVLEEIFKKLDSLDYKYTSDQIILKRMIQFHSNQNTVND